MARYFIGLFDISRLINSRYFRKISGCKDSICNLAMKKKNKVITKTVKTTKLIPAADFERSGRCPVNLRWLIFHQQDSLQEEGAIIRYGKRRWLIDEDRFINWIRRNGENFSTPR